MRVHLRNGSAVTSSSYWRQGRDTSREICPCINMLPGTDRSSRSLSSYVSTAYMISLQAY